MCAAMVCVHSVMAQQKRATVIPTRELSAPEAQTLAQFASVASVRETSAGNVMVVDDQRKQLIVFDHAFANPTVALDSASMVSHGFAHWTMKIAPFIGDSSIFVDGKTMSLVVLDGTGVPARTIRMTTPLEAVWMSSMRGVDAKGNVLYSSLIDGADMRDVQKGMQNGVHTASVMRFNLKSSARDIVTHYSAQSSLRSTTRTDKTGVKHTVAIVNPLAQSDDWAVLSDGSIAVVFGVDYHVEVLQPNGKALPATTLPFETHTLTNAEKQAIVDSARAMQTAAASDESSPIFRLFEVTAGVQAAGQAGMINSTGGHIVIRQDSVSNTPSAPDAAVPARSSKLSAPVSFTPPPLAIEFVPMDEMNNTIPVFAAGAIKPDRDARAWILTTSRAGLKPGESLYDVIDNHGELIEHVRVPAGRSIAGFGRGGVVYLKYRDAIGDWALERTKVVEQ